MFQTNKKRIVTFSAISLTDIVLLLLIFFLLSSSFFVQPGLKINLPKAVTGQIEEKNRVYLTLTRSEMIYLNNVPVVKNELGFKLKQQLKNNPDKLVVIRADKDLTLDFTVEIIDIAKLAGAEKFLIATQPGERL
ncbi:MAG: biopolymer transporter ExbD [Calditrichaeota bacterium]|nr:biopolymer transporter ExbD [Calditrichota bacterium]